MGIKTNIGYPSQFEAFGSLIMERVGKRLPADCSTAGSGARCPRWDEPRINANQREGRNEKIMAVFEIINPSDPYTLKCDRFDIVAAACLFLGEGRYGLEECGGEEGKQKMPVLIFGGAMEWFQETFQADLSEFIGHNLLAIADCLDSVVIGQAGDRLVYEQALALIPDEEGKKTWRESWHDKRLSSMNDIGARALRLADILRKKAV